MVLERNKGSVFDARINSGEHGHVINAHDVAVKGKWAYFSASGTRDFSDICVANMRRVGMCGHALEAAAIGSKDFDSSVNIFSKNGTVSNVAATKESFEVSSARDFRDICVANTRRAGTSGCALEMAAVGSTDFDSSVNVFNKNGTVLKESFEVINRIAAGAMKGNAS